jgi:SusD/RagB-like outer membrane lipoprotein
MKKIKILLPIVAFSLFSCNDYLDVNNSPNNPQADLVTPDLSLSAAQTDTYRNLTRRMNEYGNVMAGNWGANVNSFTGGYAEEFSFSYSNAFYDDVWDGVYRSSANLSNIINHTAPGYDNHKAIAKILKAFYFQYLVDLYGDIPYFQAHLGTANLTPAYDDDEVIYRDLVEEVEEAVAMIDNAPASTIEVGAEDVILGGDMDGWKKFANTLKMRLLLREATKAETNAASATYVADEFAELVADNATFVTENVTINPGYSNASDDRQNPFYNLMYDLKDPTDPTRAERNAFRFRRASQYIASKLNSNPTDPRRGRIFSLVSGAVAGVKQGDVSVPEGTAPTSISSLGAGLVVNSNQDGYMILASESMLLQAEAMVRGYLPGGDAAAQVMFDNAILASFQTLGATPGTYVADVNLVAGKGFGVAATLAEKITAIMYQKDIALNGINGAEIFIDLTRTRYIDAIPLPWSAFGVDATTPTGFRPRRLMYPISEYTGNSGNVPNQTLNQAFTTAPFWFN